MGLKECVIALLASATISCGPLYLPEIPDEIRDSQIRLQEDRFMRRAQTRYEDETYTISYSASWLRSLPEEAQMFVILHEYAHIRLDHMGRPIFNWDRAETDADCMAGEMLRDEYDYDQERLMVVHDFIDEHLHYVPRREDAFRDCMGL